ncbi:hypothetical protein HYH03_011403 [Edaphochlamys debaryana]|uniref:Uncharacterized protein n=1 Tax=Edaphochlamys debaryana TaxID=47281 RepID=A0A835XRZ4_9CHLO|nr:hypothetical protein HYH03_011403 [Edaphochlamys debaryana]|eukprot:KAG2490097.1 hypothetical protein HYH03_011403 [Edaphochlamys debaryana]
MQPTLILPYLLHVPYAPHLPYMPYPVPGVVNDVAMAPTAALSGAGIPSSVGSAAGSSTAAADAGLPPLLQLGDILNQCFIAAPSPSGGPGEGASAVTGAAQRCMAMLLAEAPPPHELGICVLRESLQRRWPGLTLPKTLGVLAAEGEAARRTFALTWEGGGTAQAATLLQRHGLRELLAMALVAWCGLTGRRVCDVNRAERAALVTALTAYELPYAGHEEYKKAEVTGGGVRLEVDCATLESRLLPVSLLPDRLRRVAAAAKGAVVAGAAAPAAAMAAVGPEDAAVGLAARARCPVDIAAVAAAAAAPVVREASGSLKEFAAAGAGQPAPAASLPLVAGGGRAPSPAEAGEAPQPFSYAAAAAAAADAKVAGPSGCGGGGGGSSVASASSAPAALPSVRLPAPDLPSVVAAAFPATDPSPSTQLYRAIATYLLDRSRLSRRL